MFVNSIVYRGKAERDLILEDSKLSSIGKSDLYRLSQEKYDSEGNLASSRNSQKLKQENYAKIGMILFNSKKQTIKSIIDAIYNKELYNFVSSGGHILPDSELEILLRKNKNKLLILVPEYSKCHNSSFTLSHRSFLQSLFTESDKIGVNKPSVLNGIETVFFIDDFGPEASVIKNSVLTKHPKISVYSLKAKPIKSKIVYLPKNPDENYLVWLYSKICILINQNAESTILIYSGSVFATRILIFKLLSAMIGAEIYEVCHSRIFKISQPNTELPKRATLILCSDCTNKFVNERLFTFTSVIDSGIQTVEESETTSTLPCSQEEAQRRIVPGTTVYRMYRKIIFTHYMPQSYNNTDSYSLAKVYLNLIKYKYLEEVNIDKHILLLKRLDLIDLTLKNGAKYLCQVTAMGSAVAEINLDLKIAAILLNCKNKGILEDGIEIISDTFSICKRKLEKEMHKENTVKSFSIVTSRNLYSQNTKVFEILIKTLYFQLAFRKSNSFVCLADMQILYTNDSCNSDVVLILKKQGTKILQYLTIDKPLFYKAAMEYYFINGIIETEAKPESSSGLKIVQSTNEKQNIEHYECFLENLNLAFGESDDFSSEISLTKDFVKKDDIF
ncbi:hypothetical protein ENBRE01_0627 [Enteropsectra breve]|nr:hypothetical protein ENBRE01_0627 [Enteropsectra breve]